MFALPLESRISYLIRTNLARIWPSFTNSCCPFRGKPLLIITHFCDAHCISQTVQARTYPVVFFRLLGDCPHASHPMSLRADATSAEQYPPCLSAQQPHPPPRAASPSPSPRRSPTRLPPLPPRLPPRAASLPAFPRRLPVSLPVPPASPCLSLVRPLCSSLPWPVHLPASQPPCPPSSAAAPAESRCSPPVHLPAQ